MPRLLVAPLSSLADAMKAHEPSHLVSLLSPEHMIETPPGFPQALHLKLGVNDIVDPAAGTAPPCRDHIDSLLAFARKWDAKQPLLIHCWAGSADYTPQFTASGSFPLTSLEPAMPRKATSVTRP